ncbi:MAG: hypothetical protein GY851_29260, partial [bacterium]|nr:hypothetical protein [bacterium]
RPKMGNFVDVFGPYAYAWNYGGVHFVALVTEGFLSDFERERQMRWWRRDMELLPPDKPVVILAHIPGPISSELQGFSKRNNIAAVLFGHWHTHHQYEVDGIPLVTSSPLKPTDWGAFTKRARAFTFKEGELTSTTRVLEQRKRLTILSPGPSADRATISVTAAVYDTVIVPDRVLATVKSTTGDGAWEQPLEQVDNWTWTSTMSEALPVGSYHLEVTVSGHEDWTAQRAFTVGGAQAPVET